MDIVEIGAKVGIYYIPFLFALCFHEVAHGWVAKLRGDNTAEMQGRLTLNPMVHIDWIGTVALPLASIIFGIPIFFGWAKPVPFNPRNLKNPRTDAFWIALAGPLSNLLLAALAALFVSIAVRTQMLGNYSSAALELTKVFILTNLFLAFFNLIPIHPLDGGKVLARFLPTHINYKLEQNEQMLSLLLMVLIFSGALRVLSIPVMWAYNTMMTAALSGLL